MKSSTLWILGGVAVAAGLWWLSKNNTPAATTAPLPSITPLPAIAPITVPTTSIPTGSSSDYSNDNALNLIQSANTGLNFNENPSLSVTDLMGNPLQAIGP